MSEGLTFSTPHEELSYLRSKVLEQERRIERQGNEPQRNEIVKESIQNFKETQSNSSVLHKEEEAHTKAESLIEKEETEILDEIITITESKGILHALSIVDKLKNWKLEDNYHNFLVDLISKGLPPSGVKEKGPIFQALHMSLYEIVLPKGPGGSEKPLSELFKSMEQLYAGLLSIQSDHKEETDYMAFEIANPEGTEDTRAFAAIPTSRKQLFEKQILSLFPDARLIERERDYNIFNESGVTMGATAKLSAPAAYPIKTFENFGQDPLNVILNGFSKIPTQGAGAAIQIIFRPTGDRYNKKYSKALEEIRKGKNPKEILREESISMEVTRAIGSIFIPEKKKGDGGEKVVDQKIVESITKKLESPIIETNIRLAVSTPSEVDSKQLLHNFQSAFNQFENAGVQKFNWESAGPGTFGNRTKESDFYRAFTFRLFRQDEKVPLNLHELSGILHFHTDALSTSSTLKRSTAKSAPAPLTLPEEGTLIGINSYQGSEKKIFMAPEDRLRHFYIIGQTGTGKSSLLKNMIYEDIQAGHGVCMIDPHGSDIQDVLGYVPAERMDDVIYFDPASTDRPMALNMLEYDPKYPEQKTFVVNELFSIFQKLYGGTPESMGPMFEQYFRNATMLVIEDPETGCTLLDVSRVMSDKSYRDLKISRCKNPVVVQFWTEIAGKAGGEASLANMVPYITSKFDVFLANDIMRPIIAQEKSSLNFREIMDGKKILLVNLSKGRLGDINANLIGLILVGKILMAALSRVDSIGKDLPPFYLTIDEFQNITTNSIATILSEARKYKLSLNIAHQFISQIDEKIRDAVFGNVGSVATFRVGNDDAEYLEKQFAPTFTAKDIANIDNLHAYVKMLVHGKPTEAFDIKLAEWPKSNPEMVTKLKELSSLKYGRNREEVEASIMAKYKKTDQAL
jgi:hypothetical protein